MSSELLDKYRSISLNFIDKNKSDLVLIYINHYKNEGEGILAINFTEVETKSNVDVSYISSNILPLELVEKIKERKLVNNENIIYFLLITPFDEQIVEIDIRTIM